VRLPEFDNRPLLFEATLDSNCTDVQDGYIKFGTQLVDLRMKIRTYHGAAVWRQLTFPRSPELIDRTREFIQEVRGKPYEISSLELLKAFFGANTKVDSQSYFCSELVAAFYMRVGIITTKLLSDNYLPSNFSTESDGDLPLMPGATLGSEVVIHQCSLDTPIRDYYISTHCSPSPLALAESKEVIVISLLSAIDLTKQLGEFNPEPLDGEPNPYCVFYLGLPPGQAATVTSKDSKGYNPVWNQTLTLPFVTEGCMLKVVVKSKNLLRDATLGYAVFELNDLKPDEERDMRIRLQQGGVHVVVSRKPKHKA